MAKRKSRQLGKDTSLSGPTLSGKDDWVIVKKQRITILIPPLHSCEPTAACADPCADTIEDIPTPTTEKQSLLTSPTNQLKHVADGKADHIMPHPDTGSQFPKKVPSKELNLGKGKDPNLTTKRMPCVSDKPIEVRDTRSPLKQPRRLLIGATASFDGGVFLNQMMRASNLDKKIHRAGGLSNWLASLGLHQFVGLFNRRKVDKFQLVNLTMKKLKDMGAVAVGPRRKLMHAIDCLCQPYCFKSHHIPPMQLH